MAQKKQKKTTTKRYVEKVKLSFQCKDSQFYNPETPKWNYMELLLFLLLFTKMRYYKLYFTMKYYKLHSKINISFKTFLIHKHGARLVHVQVPKKMYIYLQLSSRHPIFIIAFYTYYKSGK